MQAVFIETDTTPDHAVAKELKNLKDAVMKSEDGRSKDGNDLEKHIDAHLPVRVNEQREAFRSVEDIHGLMCMVKKTLKASLMKSFNKNLSQKDLQLIASSVVLAALSVAPYDNTRGASHLELEHEKEQNLRMANLIGFIIDPKLESREVLSLSSLLIELGYLVSKFGCDCEWSCVHYEA
ncbi:Eukaryotic translation initiation factor 3 subunit A [Camellia lanceoleosa]|uniref:Eukaryotic translation initiation factor 3 subunit A n=1 Tax=Camellia lanceoleosa TaxID=1840588 RepID=A0ACC0H973_9ERIC|nr:Eukaryotic translation initiation factor 3 subunit A [Camellia lanceoleosa]